MRTRSASFIFLFLSFMILDVNAQKAVAEKAGLFQQFHSINSAGFLVGSTTRSIQFTTVNGFQAKKLFAGIGVGLDCYYHISVPIFLELHYKLAGIKNMLDLSGAGGINIPSSGQNKNFEYRVGKYRAGGFFESGFDYRIPVKNKAFITGARFSFKQMKQIVENNVWNPVTNRIDNIPIKYDYQFNRVVVKIGWVF